MVFKLDYKNISSNYIHKFKLKTNHYSEKIRRDVSHILKKYHIDNNHETTRALGNAMRHGECPVKVTIYIYDDNKALVTIKDSGNGFDYKEVITKYNKGEKYYSYHGKGTKILAKSRAIIWFKDNGSEINIYYK